MPTTSIVQWRLFTRREREVRYRGALAQAHWEVRSKRGALEILMARAVERKRIDDLEVAASSIFWARKIRWIICAWRVVACA